MEVFNILFESAEILKKEVREIEKRNIISLQQTKNEIQELLTQLPVHKKPRVIYVHDTSTYRYKSNFPVDHRIIKR